MNTTETTHFQDVHHFVTYKQTIGKSAFYSCSTLKHIFIFRGVEYIGYQAFSGCEPLKLISIKEELRQENLGLSNTTNIINNENDPSSLYEFEQKLRNGSDVEVDKKEVIKYYKMEIDHGNSDAMYNYSWMLNNGEGVPIIYEEAIKF